MTNETVSLIMMLGLRSVLMKFQQSREACLQDFWGRGSRYLQVLPTKGVLGRTESLNDEKLCQHETPLRCLGPYAGLRQQELSCPDPILLPAAVYWHSSNRHHHLSAYFRPVRPSRKVTRSGASVSRPASQINIAQQRVYRRITSLYSSTL